MNYKHGWRRKEDHPLETRKCMGYRSELVEYKGKKVWIQERCEVKFKTHDDTKMFCSMKCRVGYHRRMKRAIDE